MASLTNWYNQPLGQTLSHFENTELSQLLPHYHGQLLLQLGGETLLPALNSSPVTKKFGIPTNLYASYTALPIATESVDIAILWHSLETEKQPEMMLNEVWRTLTANGHLIIMGFNPLSLWGIKALLDQTTAPWNSHFHSVHTLYHWINNIGAEIVTAKSFFYRPPLQNASLLHKLHWLEGVGLWLWPQLGAVYLLSIKKHVPPLTPIKAKWNWQTVLTTQPTVGNMRRE